LLAPSAAVDGPQNQAGQRPPKGTADHTLKLGDVVGSRGDPPAGDGTGKGAEDETRPGRESMVAPWMPLGYVGHWSLILRQHMAVRELWCLELNEKLQLPRPPKS
jgi:hypothetical protein